MDGRVIGLFIHITGALGFFAALGLEWTGLGQIRSASLPEQVRAWTRIFKNAHRVGSIAMPAIVLTGVYSMFEEFGAVPWIIVSLGSFALVMTLSVVLTNPRMALIERVLATDERPTSQTFRNLASDPLLWISIQTRVAIVLGVLLLMLAKPDYAGSLLVIGIAILLGVASAFAVLRRERVGAKSARVVIALSVLVLVAVLGLLAGNSISANTITSAKPTADVQVVQIKPTAVQTEAGSQNLSTLVPTPLSKVGPTSSPTTAGPDGQSILQNRCTGCHSLQPIRQSKRTRAEWEKVLSKMVSNGAKISDTEKTTLLDYLTSADKP